MVTALLDAEAAAAQQSETDASGVGNFLERYYNTSWRHENQQQPYIVRL